MAISELQLPSVVTTHQLADAKALAARLAADVAERLRQAIAKKGRACLVLSGGRSPVPFLEQLASAELDWTKVTVSLADERWVPVSHPDSNEGLLRRHLLQGPAAAARLVGLYQSAASLEQAAERADAVLAELPPIDVLVLGMGEDGHTASLFPDSPNLEAALDPRGARRCLPMQAPSVPRQRLSMSLALLASARLTLLALHGPGKLATLNQALAGESYEAMPIRAFLARPLEIYWCP